MQNRPSRWLAALALFLGGGLALSLAPLPLSSAVSSPSRASSSFSVERIFLGGAPQRIEAGDFDGDGDTDLVVLSSSTEAAALTVLRNNGDDSVVALSAPSTVLETTFTTSWVAELAPPAVDLPSDVEIGDLDGDGDLDLFVNIPFGITGAGCSSRLNAGDGTFDVAVPVILFSQRVDQELGDLDGDSVLDYGYHEFDLIGYIGTREGNGDGSFQQLGPEINGSTPDPKLRTAIGEVTGDALLDLVMASNSNLQLARGVATTTIPGWKHPVETLATGAFADVVLADVDLDGNTDAVATRATLDRIVVLFGQSGGGLGSPVSFPTGPKPDAVAVADFGGDSIPDVVTTHKKRGLVSVLHGAGGGVLFPPESFYATPFPTDAVAADLDDDGDADLAVTDYREGTVVLLFNLVIP